MNNLIRAELLKLRTIRTFTWSVIAALAFVPVSIALAIAKVGAPPGTILDSAEGFRNVSCSWRASSASTQSHRPS